MIQRKYRRLVSYCALRKQMLTIRGQLWRTEPMITVYFCHEFFPTPTEHSVLLRMRDSIEQELRT